MTDDIVVPCECGREIKMRTLRHITKEELEEALNQDILPENFLSTIKRNKNKRGVTFEELADVLKQRIRPIEVICMHCHAVNNLEDIILNYNAKPYRHPGRLKHTWMV